MKAIDLGQRAVLCLSGGDRQRYLNGQVSNDVRKLSETNSMLACVTTLKGKLDALVSIVELNDCYLIDSEIELRDSLSARLDKYIIADDCELSDVTDDWHLVHVLGNFQSDALTRQSERFGELGTDVYLAAGAALPEGLEFLTEVASEALRVKNVVPKWGAELTPDTLPAEAGLDVTAIDFHKGCYIGQEVISRIKSVGRVNRKLVRLKISGEPAEDLAVGQVLISAEKEVGILTTAVGNEALAYVKRDYHEAGTRLSLADPDKKSLSTTVEIVECRQV